MYVCMCMYVCMYVCMNLCMCAGMCVYVCMYARVRVYIPVRYVYSIYKRQRKRQIFPVHTMNECGTWKQSSVLLTTGELGFVSPIDLLPGKTPRYH